MCTIDDLHNFVTSVFYTNRLENTSVNAIPTEFILDLKQIIKIEKHRATRGGLTAV